MHAFFRSVGPLVLACACLAAPAGAATNIVAFGGGPDPAHDQLSLLSNAAYFDRVRHRLGVDGAPYELYFGDGGAGRTVRATAPDDDRQDVVNALARVVYGSEEADAVYRRADLTGIAGPSTADNLEHWFDRAAKRLAPRDRLVFYFTGHGGADAQGGSTPRNTTMFMWGSPAGYTMRRFAAQLDKLDPAVETTLIMVQCHSGGFANVIYNGGDPGQGYARRLRAGFFSTTAARLAAGCTPEIDEADYHEFSTSFFEALCGETRLGRPAPRADYDGDGRVSYAEAFAYAVLTSPTIDIPMCTSDQLLRDKSRYATASDGPAVLPRDAGWPAVIAAATPAQRAVLDGLSEKLELTGDDRLRAAAKLADRLSRDMNRPTPRTSRPADGDGGPSTAPSTQPFGGRFGRRGGNGGGGAEFAARRRLLDGIARRWPELLVPFDRHANEIIDAEGPAIMAFLKSQPDYATLTAAVRQRREAQTRQEQTELKWVLTQRLLERARTVILANNLAAIGDAEALRVYASLLRLEGKGLDNAD